MMRQLRTFFQFHWANMRRFVGLRTHDRRHFLAAEHHFTQALALNGNHQQARINRGVLRWRELDNWAGAIADFTTLLVQYPHHYLPLFYRSMAFCRAGDYHAAVRDLDAFIRADPQSRWVHHAIIQLDGLLAIIEDLSPMLPDPRLVEISNFTGSGSF
jgi:tetratricopeptide (TPR) repeat protein